MVLAACSVNAQNLVYTANSSSNAPISVAVDISQGNKYGIDLSNGATVTLDGPSISISLTGASNTGWIEGVESRGLSSLLNLGGAQSKNINVSVNVDSKDNLKLREFKHQCTFHRGSGLRNLCTKLYY